MTKKEAKDFPVDKKSEALKAIPLAELRDIRMKKANLSKTSEAFETICVDLGFDFTPPPEPCNRRYDDVLTEAAYCAFRASLKSARRAFAQLFSTQEVRAPYIVGRLKSEGGVIIRPNPFLHKSSGQAKEEAIKLSKLNDDKMYGVFGCVEKIGSNKTGDGVIKHERE